jgi:arylsulfatase A-like enzyme
MFVHMGGMDKAGHTYGWMSDEYLAQVSLVDDDVRVLMDALRQQGLEETTLVILTADHGGLGTNHMSSHASVMTIPWIIAGPGVNAGLGLTTEVRIYDTTATVLWALGLPIPEDMAGTPVREAFGASVEVECGLLEVHSSVPFLSLELASSSVSSPWPFTKAKS